MRHFTVVFATFVLLGCSNKSERAPVGGTGSGSAAAPADARPIESPAATVKQHMREHFATVSELQRAIARGHFDTAKDHARWIVDHEEVPQLAAWTPFVDEMKQAARAIADAKDLPSAAAVTARLGRACSRCHEATQAVVAFAWEEPPAEAPSLQAQMKRHQWAAAQLWQGLVGPLDDMWHEGAQVLAATQLDAFAATGSNAPRGDVAALAKRVRELATSANKTDDQDARATIYGELLSTCAGCHALVRPTPVPGP
jgi:cytochrome c553